jgi:hypothetical protein
MQKNGHLRLCQQPRAARTPLGPKRLITYNSGLPKLLRWSHALRSDQLPKRKFSYSCYNVKSHLTLSFGVNRLD